MNAAYATINGGLFGRTPNKATGGAARPETLAALLARGWQQIGRELWHPVLCRSRPMPPTHTVDAAARGRREQLLRLQADLFCFDLDGLLAEQKPPTSPPIVALKTCAGTPTGEQTETVRREIAKLPGNALAAWARAGGRVEIVRGQTVAAHPSCAGLQNAGMADGSTIIVAAEAQNWLCKQDRERIVLHEAGHAIDHVAGYPSRRARWVEGFYPLYGQECRWRDEPAGTSYESSNPEEFFAGCFASYFDSAYRRSRLHEDLRRFIETVVEGL